MALTEPLIAILGGTDSSCELFCRVCQHAFLSHPGGWPPEPNEVSDLPLSQLIAALTEHICPSEGVA